MSFGCLILAVVAGAGWDGYRLFQAMPQRQQQIATTKVRRGDVIVRSFARGEVRAVRSATLIAPNLFGTVQVTQTGLSRSLAQEKDLIVEFDDSELQSRLEEKQLEIDQIDEQIKKAEADLAIRNNQDQVELLRARYSVRRAELEVKRNELLPADRSAEERSESRRIQAAAEAAGKRHQVAAGAGEGRDGSAHREAKQGARMEMTRERQRLSQVKLLSPMSGLVAIRQNRQGMFFPGMQIPDIREGDQVQPGMPIADVLDLSELEVVAKIGELDRANLKEGQEVNMRLDAVGEKTFHGRIKSMSGTASANIFSGDPGQEVRCCVLGRHEGTAHGARRETGADQEGSGDGGGESKESRPHRVSDGPMAMAGWRLRQMMMVSAPGPAAVTGGWRRWRRHAWRARRKRRWRRSGTRYAAADGPRCRQWRSGQGGPEAEAGRCRQSCRTEDRTEDARRHAEGSETAAPCRIFRRKSDARSWQEVSESCSGAARDAGGRAAAGGDAPAAWWRTGPIPRRNSTTRNCHSGGPDNQLEVLLRPGFARRCRNHPRKDSGRDQRPEPGRF